MYYKRLKIYLDVMVVKKLSYLEQSYVLEK